MSKGIQVFDGDGEVHKPPPKATITMDGFMVYAGSLNAEPIEPAEQKSVWLRDMTDNEYNALKTVQRQLPLRYKKFEIIVGRGEKKKHTYEQVYVSDIIFGRDGEGAFQACIEMTAIENAPILEKIGEFL